MRGIPPWGSSDRLVFPPQAPALRACATCAPSAAADAAQCAADGARVRGGRLAESVMRAMPAADGDCRGHRAFDSDRHANETYAPRRADGIRREWPSAGKPLPIWASSILYYQFPSGALSKFIILSISFLDIDINREASIVKATRRRTPPRKARPPAAGHPRFGIRSRPGFFPRVRKAPPFGRCRFARTPP